MDHGGPFQPDPFCGSVRRGHTSVMLGRTITLLDWLEILCLMHPRTQLALLTAEEHCYIVSKPPGIFPWGCPPAPCSTICIYLYIFPENHVFIAAVCSLSVKQNSGGTQMMNLKSNVQLEYNCFQCI